MLFESAVGGTLNHLGVETDGAAEVEAAEARLSGDGLTTTGIDDTICCYATKVETWVTDPGRFGKFGRAWVKKFFA